MALVTSSKLRLGFVLVVGGLAVACKTAAVTPDTPSGAIDGGSLGMFGPLDPGFSGTPAGVWTTSGGATLETSVPPGVDPGVARFDPAKIQGTAFVAQTFAMPGYSVTAQYALETTGVGEGVHARIDNMTLGDLVLGSTSSKSRICLGERAFGHDIDLAFGSRMSGTTGPDTVDLDHVAILAAPECPAAGAFLGGDFEKSDGWSIEAPSEIVATGGPSSGRAGHLVVSAARREGGLQHAPVSFPWRTMPRPAVRFVATGADLPVALRIASELASERAPALGAVLTAATPTTSVVCIPEWTKGLTLPFLFEVRQPYDLRSRDYFIDDVAFVSEPSCPESSFVLGGDFEGATANPYWAFADVNLEMGGMPATQSSGIVSTGGAHGGSSHALLSIDTTCLDASMTQTITTPVAEPGRGPAVKLWYKTSGPGKVSLGVRADERSAALPAASTWTQQTLCLDPSAASRPTTLVFLAHEAGPVGPCADQPLETFAIDDVEVTTDPSCPAK